MSRQAKIIIFSIILIFSIYQKQTKNNDFFSALDLKKTNKIDTPARKANKLEVSNGVVKKKQKALFTPKFKAKPNKNTLGINERLRIDFEINESGNNFVSPSFKGFNVVGDPQQNTSNSWMNGKRTYSKTYSYFLKPKSQGKLKIDEAFIEIEGQVYKTAPVIITVIASVTESKDKINDLLKLKSIPKPIINQPTPKNGFSPYDKYFGKGVYNNSSGNSFKIENSNETDAVVLLVNAYSGKKIRNEFVRKGTTFEMTGVPNGTYYLEWFSGTNWWGELKVGNKFKGGFQTKASFTKTRDINDWMKVEGYQIWTVTLYSVVGGEVESEKIDAEDFFN
jgi:hypothetical protein